MKGIRIACGLVGAAVAPGMVLAQPAGIIWAGAYSEAQAARGQALYGASCASCHGDALSGADVVPALSGGSFVANWQGQSAGDLARRIRTTMPLDNPGSLGLAATADITAYIFSRNGFPAGPAELPSASAAQAAVKITARP